MNGSKLEASHQEQAFYIQESKIVKLKGLDVEILKVNNSWYVKNPAMASGPSGYTKVVFNGQSWEKTAEVRRFDVLRR